MSWPTHFNDHFVILEHLLKSIWAKDALHRPQTGQNMVLNSLFSQHIVSILFERDLMGGALLSKPNGLRFRTTIGWLCIHTSTCKLRMHTTLGGLCIHTTPSRLHIRTSLSGQCIHTTPSGQRICTTPSWLCIHSTTSGLGIHAAPSGLHICLTPTVIGIGTAPSLQLVGRKGSMTLAHQMLTVA